MRAGIFSFIYLFFCAKTSERLDFYSFSFLLDSSLIFSHTFGQINFPNNINNTWDCFTPSFLPWNHLDNFFLLNNFSNTFLSGAQWIFFRYFLIFFSQFMRREFSWWIYSVPPVFKTFTLISRSIKPLHSLYATTKNAFSVKFPQKLWNQLDLISTTAHNDW